MNEENDLKYSYSSKPRAVQTNRSAKTKDVTMSPSNKALPPNIMHDPRVVRGSVFAQSHISKNLKASSGSEDKLKRKTIKSTSKKSSSNIYESSQKVQAYTFTPLNLEANLVEQLPVVPVRNVVTQSDEFVRTPSSSNQVENGKAPVFFRAKTGVDSSTQIESHDQLFHFDSEVKPLLDILVNKTIAQAITELEEEAQLRTLRNQKAFLLNQQIAENKKQKELEQKAIEINKIRQQTIANKQEKLKNLHVFEKKLLAWRMAHQILVPEVVQETKTFLIQKGVFYNPLHVDLKRWLSMDVYGLVDTKLRLQSLTRLLLDDLLETMLKKQTILSHVLPNEQEAMVRIFLKDPLPILSAIQSVETEINQEEEQQEKEEEKNKNKNNNRDLKVIGPLGLSRKDSLEVIEQKIKTWITENIGQVEVPIGGFLSLLSLSEII